MSARCVRVKMVLAYDGAGFCGFAPNRGVLTVAGVLGEALERILGHVVVLVCAGRTDKGVHALGQVVTFDADPERFDPRRLQRSLNRMCAPGIAVSHIEIVDSSFNARFSCTGRVYQYHVLNSPVNNPMLDNICWYVERPLNVDAMRVASELLVGTHDFSSFCRNSQPPKSLVRTVKQAVWKREACFSHVCDSDIRDSDMLIFEIEGRSFCHQMVRSLVSLIVSVGLGRREPDEVRDVIAARDRNLVPSPAPPRGLVFQRALYDSAHCS